MSTSMYLVKIYSAEYGDLDHVVPAASLEDGVGAALMEVGTSPKHKVSTEMIDGLLHVRVMKGDLVLASIEDVAFAGPADSAVAGAVNDAIEGHIGALQGLFGEAVGSECGQREGPNKAMEQVGIGR